MVPNASPFVRILVPYFVIRYYFACWLGSAFVTMFVQSIVLEDHAYICIETTDLVSWEGR